MGTTYQLHWGVDQWTAFLKNVDIPIMPRSKFLLQSLLDRAGEEVAPKELAQIVTGDPFLALRLLRGAERRRSRTLGHDTTTALASILQIGTLGLVRTIEHCELCDDANPGLAGAEFRGATASYLARHWASCRGDLSPDELALAALLADIGETMFWHFAPELARKIQDHLASLPHMNPTYVEQDVLGFSFRSLTLHLADAWELPPLLTALIRGVNNARANIARIACNVARHLQSDPEQPAILEDMRALHAILPHVGVRELLQPLPIPAEFAAAVEQELAVRDMSAAA